jgi:hypothetical protein
MAGMTRRQLWGIRVEGLEFAIKSRRFVASTLSNGRLWLPFAALRP